VSGLWSVGRGGGGARGGDDLDCAQVEELAPDLALGLLDGAERASVLAHVDRCASCRAEVASLTEVGDHLLQLAPEVPPPPGFESRVLTQLAPEQRQRRRHRLARRTLLAVAATVLVLAGVGALSLIRDGVGGGGGDGGGGGRGDETATPDRPGGRPTTAPPDRAAATAELHTSEGEMVGEAVLHRTAGAAGVEAASIELDLATWLAQVSRYGEPVEGTWWLHVEGAGGYHEMHLLTLDSTTTTVQVQLDDPTGDVGSVAIVDESGRAWCWGDFA
jgi:Putative zinc-finger